MMDDFKEILLVDDQIQIQELIADALRNNFYKVEACSNSYDAVKKIKEKKYDLIITDIKMPEGDGSVLLDYIQENNKDLSVIIMTAAQNISFGESVYFENQCDTILYKPFDLDELMNSVESAIN